MNSKPSSWFINGLLILAGLLVLCALVWQGYSSGGAPDPDQAGDNRLAATFDIGILVFREGLECVLVLSAITGGMLATQTAQRRSIFVGAGVGFIATLVTWFIAVGIIQSLADLQAATGLLAVVVLLIVMNWFFHKIYWGGWISIHHRQKKALLSEASASQISRTGLLFGMGLLGFSSLYREGFEVVLFLQSYNLKVGGQVVLGGTLIGLLLTGIVAALTFIEHQRLPYRKMLIFTGVMLGAVLLVMVGEQAQEMQQAAWISTTKIGPLEKFIPDWAGLWFSVFPTVETLAAQALAAALVIGSYFLSRGQNRDGLEAAPESQ